MKINFKNTSIEFSFKSKNQLPLFMVTKIWFDSDGYASFAKPIFEIKGRSYRKQLKKFMAR